MPPVLARVLLLLPLLLAACGDLPQPFLGQPGSVGARLAQPPPPRLAVPVPTDALLTQAASKTLARDVADALVDQEVPAVTQAVRRGDWQLVVTAELQGRLVVPTYTVRDDKGHIMGSSTGVGMPAHAWANGDPYVLKMAAAAAGPKIADLLIGIDAARKRSDPHSLYNRPAQVAVPDVTGAPGDGNQSLARQMRLQLPKVGEVVRDSRQGADFTVAGQVRTAPGAGGSTRIEIQWVVTDAAGHEIGRVIQLNEVPPGSLDHFWGDVALVVAQEAAGGVQRVIMNQIGGRQPGKDGTAAAQPTASKPASAGQ